MKEQVIEFKTAKLAKEKGFNEKCFAFYDSAETLINPLEAHDNNKNIIHSILLDYNNLNIVEESTKNKVQNYSAPTQSLLQKWLREEHDIHVEVNNKSLDPLLFEHIVDYIVRNFKVSSKIIKEMNHSEGLEFKTYEQALEEGLYQALKLIKL